MCMRKTYFKHKLENLITVNKIVTIHYFNFDKDFASKIETHDFWEIVYCDKNEVYYTKDGNKGVLKEGEILFHKPNEMHSLFSNKIDGTNVFITSFESKSEAMRFFEDKIISINNTIKNYINIIINEGKNAFDLEKTNPDTKKMEINKNANLGSQQIIKNILEIMLISLLRYELNSNNLEVYFLSKEEYNKRITSLIKEFLHENIYNNVNIKTLEERLSYSRSYLFREFKKSTNLTIIEYFNNLKINEAKKLLLNSSLSVKEIAEELSFESSNYFIKLFKKLTGKTPKEYRKR